MNQKKTENKQILTVLYEKFTGCNLEVVDFGNTLIAKKRFNGQKYAMKVTLPKKRKISLHQYETLSRRDLAELESKYNIEFNKEIDDIMYDIKTKIDAVIDKAIEAKSYSIVCKERHEA